ncbi:MAG: histidine kinase, partial [Ferruginibacter sp.]
MKGNTTIGCTPRFYEWQAEMHLLNREYDSTELCLQKAFDFYKKSSCSEMTYLNYYRVITLLSQQLGNYTRAIDMSFKMLPLTEGENYKYERATCLLLISQAFNKMKVSEKGIEYARKALPLIQQLNIPYQKAEQLNDLAKRYLWRYQDTKEIKLLDSAEQFTNTQIAISKQGKYLTLLSYGYNKMNGYAHERGNYSKALLYIDSSLYLHESMDDLPQKATDYGDKADVFMEMGNYKEASRFADSCLRLNQLNKNPELIANAYALIYQINNRSGNYKNAIDAMNSYLEINDSLVNVEKVKNINELEKKYNQAKNENKIKDLDKKKQLYFFLAIAGLLAALAIAFYLRQQSLKHKKNILETEQRLNRARMNPHFFFNALTTLQKVALRDNDGQAMASNLSKFSNIMRETLESTYKEYVTIEQEMEFLNEYLEVQKIRFPQTFSYEVNADKDLDIDELQIPAMIIQPFVENSIEHGFVGADYPGKVSVNFTKDNKDLLIQITDNGKGLNTTAKENNEHISRASQIIKDRIYLLNIKLKTKAGFSIDNNSTGNGVIVKIHLPLLYKD